MYGLVYKNAYCSLICNIGNIYGAYFIHLMYNVIKIMIKITKEELF